MKYYLDASPMIRALSESPSEFEMEGNFVRHKPSRHVLKFDVHGDAQLVARCNCSQLPINQQQNVELRAAVAVWMDFYWRPLMARQAAAIGHSLSTSGPEAYCGGRWTPFCRFSASAIRVHSTGSTPRWPRTQNFRLHRCRRCKNRSGRSWFRREYEPQPATSGSPGRQSSK
jgi:hypothetical protein